MIVFFSMIIRLPVTFFSKIYEQINLRLTNRDCSLEWVKSCNSLTLRRDKGHMTPSRFSANFLETVSQVLTPSLVRRCHQWPPAATGGSMALY